MRPLLRAALALLFCSAFAGCSSDRNELIRVGQQVVTVDEFKTVARGNEGQYLGTPDQAKAALFQDLLRRALLLHEAEQRGLYRDTLLIRLRNAAEERLLVEAVYQRMSPARAQVSDAEVARAVAWRDTASRLLAIFTIEPQTARGAAAEARAGANFSALSDRYSPPGLLPPGGDFGYLTPGTLIAPLDTYLRTAPVGDIVGPIEANGEGWFVLQVVAREARPQGSVESQTPVVREMLRQRKRRLAALRAYQDLKRAYDVRLERNAAALVFARYNAASDPLAGLGQRLAPAPGTEDESQVLARWVDGVTPRGYRLGDALDDLQSSDHRPPDLTNINAIRNWIEQRAMRRVAFAEARRRGLDHDPEIRRRMDSSADNEVLQAIYEQDVAAEARLLPLDVPAFYPSVRDNYQKLDQITLESTFLADSGLAQAVMQHGGHAPSLAAALAMVNATEPVQLQTVRYPSSDEKWRLLQATFMRMPAGQTAGPMRTPEGWLIVRVVSKQQRSAEFSELEPPLRQAVEQMAEERRRDEALRRVTDHLQRLYAPVLHPERLKDVPWPVEPALTPIG